MCLITSFPSTLGQAGCGDGPEKLTIRHALRIQKRAHQFRRAIAYQSEWRSYFFKYYCDLPRWPAQNRSVSLIARVLSSLRLRDRAAAHWSQENQANAVRHERHHRQRE